MGCCAPVSNNKIDQRQRPYRQPRDSAPPPSADIQAAVKVQADVRLNPAQNQAQRQIKQAVKQDIGPDIFHPRKATVQDGGEDSERKRKTTFIEQPEIPHPELQHVLKALEERAKNKEEDLKEEDDSDSEQMVEDESEHNKNPLMISRLPTAFEKLEQQTSGRAKLLQVQASFEIAPQAEEQEEDKKGDSFDMFNQQPTEYPEFYLLARLRSKTEVEGDIFIDASFPHSNDSIFDKERGANEKLEGLEWKRARDIFGNNYDILPERDEDFSPNAIKQGVLGDCYFLSGLAALAEWPQRVRELFVTDKPNKSGRYVVRLFLNGERFEIEVDEYFPHKNGFAFCHCGDEKHIWPMLLEKAYAKVFGSYQRIESGTMMESLQVLTCSFVDLYDHSKMQVNELWQEILRADKQDFIMLTNVHSESENTSSRVKALGLVDNHAYTLIGAHQIEPTPGERVRLLKVRNPWGRGEWGGDWSDSSSKWTQELKQQLGFQNRDDGIFFIAIQDFVKHFHNTTIAKVHDGWYHSVERLASKRGDFHGIHVSVSENTDVQFLYFQPGLRYLTGTKDTNFTFDLLNFAIVRCREDNTYEWIDNESFLRKTNCSCMEGNLRAGEYVIFTEIEEQTTKPADEKVHSWFVLRSNKQIQKMKNIPELDPQFLEKMMKACALAKTNSYIYQDHPEVQRYFAMSESGTSFAAFYYSNESDSNKFQEKMMFTCLDGVYLLNVAEEENNDMEFQVNLNCNDETTILLRRRGKENTRVSYKFISRSELGEQALIEQALENGKSLQIKNYLMANIPLEVKVRSFFSMGQGVLLVVNEGISGTKLEFTFKFEGSENLRIRGLDGTIKEISIKSRPGTQIPIILEAINVWESMPIRYSYSYRIL